MYIFYAPEINNNKLFTLPEEESKHCIQVLRMKKGDEIQIIDGAGNLYSGNISVPDPHRCLIAVSKVTPEYHSKSYRLHVAIAPTRSSERFEWFLEKATEIGIDEITPLICSRSERKNLRHDRMEKIIIAAMKQSVIARKPVLNALKKLDAFMKDLKDRKSYRFIAHCNEGIRENIRSLYNPGHNIICLIGPEGDFTYEEVESAVQNGFHPVTLGINRLRTETAGVVVCEVFSVLNEV